MVESMQLTARTSPNFLGTIWGHTGSIRVHAETIRGSAAHHGATHLVLADVRVDLCRREMPVAERDLNDAEVPGLPPECCGECVAECVDGDGAVDSGEIDQRVVAVEALDGGLCQRADLRRQPEARRLLCRRSIQRGKRPKPRRVAGGPRSIC